MEDIQTFLDLGCDVNYNGTFFNAKKDCENSTFSALGIPCKKLEVITGYTPLNLAALKGTNEAMGKLLQVPGIDVNAASTFPSTPLYSAVEKGNLDMVKMLIEAGADIDTKAGPSKISPLVRSILSKFSPNLALVEYLIEKGANVNDVTGNGNSAIYHAAGEEDVGILKALVLAGADVNQVNTGNKLTPLFNAIGEGHQNNVKWLIQNDANVSADSSLWTPAYYAIEVLKVFKSTLTFIFELTFRTTDWRF